MTRSGTASRLLTAFIAVIAAILVCEVVLRLLRDRELTREVKLIERILSSNAAFPRSQLEVYDGRHDEAAVHFEAVEELKLAYRPYVERRRIPNQSGSGVHINRLGYRGPDVTIPKPEGCLRILVLGGSFVWGTGALRDEETIPGHLQRVLNDRHEGIEFEVINGGETGFVTSQEINLLVHEGLLLEPDWVVSIDGYNDAHNFAYGLPAGYPGHYWQFNRLLSTAYQEPVRRTLEEQMAFLQNQRDGTWALGRKPEIARLLDRVTDKERALHKAEWAEVAIRHLHNIAVIEALSDDFGFQTLFVFQPVLATGKPLTDQERAELDRYRRWNTARYDWMVQNYRRYGEFLEARCRERGTRFLNLTDAFADHPEALYIDFSHLGGEGYELVAERIAAAVSGDVVAPAK